MRSLGRKALVAGCAIALLAAGCGGDDDDSSGGGGGGGGGGEGSGEFSEPLMIGTLWEVQGESAVAIDDYENAAQMAIDEINEAGGVGGHDVETFRVATSVLDLQAAQSSFLEAVDQDPDVMVGFALPAQVQALSPQIERTGIPVVATTNGQPFLRYGSEDANSYTWIAKPYDPHVVKAGVDYMIEELDVQEFGIMSTNESNGQSGAEAATAAIEEGGAEVAAEASYAPTSTDLTAQVLEMEGTDAVVHWGFPNTVPVQLNQFAANDIDVPTLGNDSAAIAVASGSIEGDPIDDLYVTGACNPADPESTPSMGEFAANYEERYGVKATVSAGIVYDAIYIAVAAAEAAGSTDPEAINEAMAEVERPDGACGNYKADGAHILNHQAVVSKYSADGTNETVSVVETAQEEEQG